MTTKQPGISLISWRAVSSMNEHDVLKKNRNFYIGVGGTVLEGLLSGSLFMLLYSVMQFLWSSQFDMNRVLALTGIIAVIFLLRILIYSYGYTKAQIGGAEVSKNIRLFMGDHLKRIPLSRFTQGQTGDYINTITSDVNNYEKILTHKVGDLAKNFALSFMLIIFVMTIYVPAGIILLIADLLLIPGLWLSFRMVQKYGKEKNDICAENVSSIVEYVSGIQTFRAYGVGGMKNKTVINAMREFSRISFVYEAKVLPIGTGFGILSWLSCPLVIWLAYTPWAAGTLNTVDYLLICMLPLFCAKLANSIFVDLTSYKNLMISKNKILGVMNEPEETGSMEPLHTTTHEIIFDNVDFSYVPGEPVLKHATFTVPDQKLTAIVGDSGSGKSTILNLIAKYYEATGGTISIGGKPINHVAAERVLEQVSMVDQDVFLFDDTIRDNIRHARPNATDAEIEAACRLIRSLNPRPGAAFDQDVIHYIVPDVRIARGESGRLCASLINQPAPPAIAPQYMEYLKAEDEPQRQYVRDNLMQARSFLFALKERAETLLAIASLAVAVQEEYLTAREPGALRPLTMTAAARKTGLSLSTVSRTVNGKYAEFEGRVFPLRMLFTAGGKAGHSREAIVRRMRALLSTANGEPMSDARLAALLAAEGMPVSRRTVNKYRNAFLKIDN